MPTRRNGRTRCLNSIRDSPSCCRTVTVSFSKLFWKPDDVVADASQCLQKFGIRLAMRFLELRRLDAERLGRQLFFVELAAVFEHGGQTTLLHVAADAFDDLLGRERLAKQLDGAPSSGLRNDVAARTQLRRAARRSAVSASSRAQSIVAIARGFDSHFAIVSRSPNTVKPWSIRTTDAPKEPARSLVCLVGFLVSCGDAGTNRSRPVGRLNRPEISGDSRQRFGVGS